MPRVKLVTKGRHKTESFLENTQKTLKNNLIQRLEYYGEKGVRALSDATPVDTGKTSKSWKYEIEKTDRGISIHWLNTNIVDDWCNVAIMIQYGHATRNGGWVEGRDYINPAIRPIFDEMAKNIWKEVISE